MNVEEYLRLSNMTRNSELELISLYNKKQRILEAQSHRAKQAVLELDKMVLVLRQEVNDLKMKIEEQKTMHSETKERKDALSRENDELREMIRGSQRMVLKDHTELEKEINILRKENSQLQDQVTGLQQERDEAEKRKKDLLVENARATQQNTCLMAENGMLLHENERINRVLHAKDAKTAHDIEEAKSELVQRNKELECSNKELGASLLNMQLQYNDLLVKNAEILKNAGTGKNTEKRAAGEASDKCSNGTESSAGERQTAVQKEDVVAILRELLQQNGIRGYGTLTEKMSSQELSGKDPEVNVVGSAHSKSTTKEKDIESKPATQGITRRGRGRPPSKHSRLQPEKALQNIQPVGIENVVLGGSSSEEKDSIREVTVGENKNAQGGVVSSNWARCAKNITPDIRHRTQNEMPLKKKAKSGISAYGTLATKKNEIKEPGDLGGKNMEDVTKDSGATTKEIAKIDNESFFANLTFSSSSPFFKK